ncbi:MAG: DUF488 family protein [Euryarchaeota archaeon]|nr:DUF488 family protein [Euryarchaeota archaeon]
MALPIGKRPKSRGDRPDVGVVKTKHLRLDPLEPSDGTRILVSRFYPRGYAKGRETWDEWRKELGPSRELHGEVKANKVGMETYRRRFENEMEAPEAQEAITGIARRVAEGESVTLLCDHLRSAPAEGCHRFIVAGLIEEAARAGPRGGS